MNLTDGLDGLAITPVILVCVGLGIFTYLSGHINFANYLLIPHLPGVGELTIFIGAIVGSGLGFLWYILSSNIYGRCWFIITGSSYWLRSNGSATRNILIIMGGIFVAETISVIIQITSIKLFNRKYFYGLLYIIILKRKAGQSQKSYLDFGL